LNSGDEAAKEDALTTAVWSKVEIDRHAEQLFKSQKLSDKRLINLFKLDLKASNFVRKNVSSVPEPTSNVPRA